MPLLAKGSTMPPATGLRSTLSDEELQKLVAQIKEVDSIELKLTVPEPTQMSTARALDLDPLQAEMRQVFFFETPDLALDKAGLVVRARRSQKKGDDSVVKLRPVVPSELPKATRRSPSFGVELDASPKGYVVSGSMKGVPADGDVRKAFVAGRPVRKLFSKGQRALFDEHAPKGVALDDLVMLGPLLVLKLKWAPADFDRKLVAELWLYPDGSRILELSTKCAPTEAFQVATETRSYLASRGVDLATEQATKTRSALEFFAKQLEDAKPAAPATTAARKPRAGTKTRASKSSTAKTRRSGASAKTRQAKASASKTRQSGASSKTRQSSTRRGTRSKTSASRP
jgi:hypothetical protein